jgi:succinate dehydrogenase / fumarate reductase membrane anchor subunit
MSLRSPLGRVLGLGTAKDGTSHWWGQRVSGIALAFLGLWFVIGLIMMPGYSYPEAVTFISELPNPVLLMLLIVTMAYHSYLGVQVVIEDYIHGHGLKIASLVISRFAHILLAVVGLFAILRLGIGA